MKDLTVGSPSKLIIEFAIPIFLGNIFQLLYNLVDTRIVGSTLGNEALAAVGATSTLNNLIIGFLIGLTNGFAIWVARDFGAHEEEEMRKEIAGILILGLAISFLLTIVSVYFLRDLLHLLNMPEALMENGIGYIRVILIGMTAAMLYNISASVLRAIGDTMAPLCFLIGSTLMNIGLDYFFILSLGMGTQGAAYATVIAQSLAAFLCFIYIWKRYPMIHLHKQDCVLKRLRVKKSVTLATWAWCALVVIASYTISPYLVRLVTATKIQEVIDTATLYLRIDTLFYMVPAVISIFRNALQGLGDHKTPIISSGIELIGKVMVVVLLTPRLQYMGIILAEPIVWILMVIPLIIRILTIPALKNQPVHAYEG